jgi:hypothetical protein
VPPSGHREAVLLCRGVELAPGEPRPGAAGPPVWIDLNALHRAQVDHHPVVADGASGHVVTAAVHGDRQPGLARELHRRRDVGRAATARDHPRAPVDHPVERPSQLVVARIPRRDDLAAEAEPLEPTCIHIGHPLPPSVRLRGEASLAADQPRYIGELPYCVPGLPPEARVA